MKKVITITGKSGSGKSTLAKKLTDTGLFGEVISFTTRLPRDGEVNGVDYNFISMEEAEKIVKNNEALQHVIINGNHYGSHQKTFEDIYNRGQIPILVCDPKGPQDLEKNKDKMGWKVTKIFLDVEPETLSTRIVDRFSKEYTGEKPNIEKIDKEIEKRLNMMTSMNKEEVNFFIDKLKSNEFINDLKDILTKEIKESKSIESTWRNQIKFDYYFKAEDIEKNNDKYINKIKKISLKEQKNNYEP